MTSPLITCNSEFQKLCENIKGSPFIAVDTEFFRSGTYYAELCLLQIADRGNKNVAVVDCLNNDMDLAPFAEILRDGDIMKILHGGRQDIEIFYRLFDFVPEPLFDTQVAAMACGLGDQIGYDVLVRKTSGNDIDKSTRLQDWRKRPLSDADIAYAAGDVIHLTQAYEWLQTRLRKKNRENWITEEMQKLGDARSYRSDPEWAWLKLKIKGSKTYRSILRELAALRERDAQRLNLPRHHIISDNAIYAIAAATPGDYRALQNATQLYRKNYKEKFANRILAAIKKGIECAHELPDVEIKKKKREVPMATDVLKTILKLVAAEHQISPRLIADADELAALFSDNYKESKIMQGWRYEVFGKYAEQFLEGRLSLGLRAGSLHLYEHADGDATGD